MNTEHLTEHLTDEQLFAIVLGEVPVGEQFSECAHCHQQVAEMTTSIGEFRRAADVWLAALPAAGAQRTARPRSRRIGLVSAVFAAALLLGAVGLKTTVRGSFHLSRSYFSAASSDSAQQISADNDLLKNIEFAVSEPPPVSAAWNGPPAQPDRSSHKGRN